MYHHSALSLFHFLQLTRTWRHTTTQKKNTKKQLNKVRDVRISNIVKDLQNHPELNISLESSDLRYLRAGFVGF